MGIGAIGLTPAHFGQFGKVFQHLAQNPELLRSSGVALKPEQLEQARTVIEQLAQHPELVEIGATGLHNGRRKNYERSYGHSLDKEYKPLTELDKDKVQQSGMLSGQNLKMDEHRRATYNMSSRKAIVIDTNVSLSTSTNAPLSAREVDVLRLVAAGLTNREIGTRLHLSRETIKTNIRRIMQKLLVTDRTEAAVKALRHGLI